MYVVYVLCVHVCVYSSIHDMCACVLNSVLTELHKTLTHSVPEEIKQSKESDPYCHHHSYENRRLPFSQFSVLGVDPLMMIVRAMIQITAADGMMKAVFRCGM